MLKRCFSTLQFQFLYSPYPYKWCVEGECSEREARVPTAVRGNVRTGWVSSKLRSVDLKGNAACWHVCVSDALCHTERLVSQQQTAIEKRVKRENETSETIRSGRFRVAQARLSQSWFSCWVLAGCTVERCSICTCVLPLLYYTVPQRNFGGIVIYCLKLPDTCALVSVTKPFFEV